MTVIAGDGEYRGSLVIGCDGVRSIVRKAMGVEYEGFTWEDRYLATSTSYELHNNIGFAGAGYIADPDIGAAVFHVPDDGPPGSGGWYFLSARMRTKRSKCALKIFRSGYSICSRARIRAPQKVSSHYTITRSIVSTNGSRPASRATDCIIAGDAAHANNPLGGLGLNSGIHDAENIASKLIQIRHNKADQNVLFDRYDRQRRPIHHKHIQAMSIRNKRMLEERDPVVRRKHLDEQRAIADDPVRTKQYLMETSMINSVREAAEIV